MTADQLTVEGLYWYHRPIHPPTIVQFTHICVGAGDEDERYCYNIISFIGTDIDVRIDGLGPAHQFFGPLSSPFVPSKPS